MNILILFNYFYTRVAHFKDLFLSTFMAHLLLINRTVFKIHSLAIV
jgi:hypothetical protein